MKFRFTLIEVLIVFAILAILAALILTQLGGCGTGGLGEKAFHKDVLIQRLYVDGNKEDSHYMVGTDKGVFEVDNGPMLGIWNADKLYSQLVVGKRYNLTTKGKEYVNWFMQEYPYIIAVEGPLPDPVVEPVSMPTINPDRQRNDLVNKSVADMTIDELRRSGMRVTVEPILPVEKE